jgi:hypothetical protein
MALVRDIAASSLAALNNVDAVDAHAPVSQSSAGNPHAYLSASKPH